MTYDSQYEYLIYFLTHGHAPFDLEPKRKRALILKPNQYQLVNGLLLGKNYDSTLLRCLEKSKAKKVLQEVHDGPNGGHYGGDTTTQSILHAIYYYPNLFKYAHAYVRKCKVCQITSGKDRKACFPLQ